MMCAACKGRCPTPQACELPVAIATKPPRAAFLLDGAFRRWPRATPAVLLVVLLVLFGLAGKGDEMAEESIELRADTEEVTP